MTYIMQFFPFIIAVAVFWYAYIYPVRKAKRLLPTLPQYLQSHPECKTNTGIKCRVCGSKSIKNWGIRNQNDQCRMFICNHCEPIFTAPIGRPAVGLRGNLPKANN